MNSEIPTDNHVNISTIIDVQNDMPNDTSNDIPNDTSNDIPSDVPLTNINLPNKWVLYLYDKQLFKKMANRPTFQAKPHKEVCTLSTVNDLIYILQLMKAKIEPKVENKFRIKSINNNKLINLDANDYIIMRKGIEPIWEDPKNANGGTFTVRMCHSKGYDVWSTFVMYMLGETMTYEMHNINGITVSFISNSDNLTNFPYSNNNTYTYIKIWDGKSNRNLDQFINILPIDLFEKIKSESIRYSQNNQKGDFNDKNIINKLNNNKKNSYNRDDGGFSSRRRKY